MTTDTAAQEPIWLERMHQFITWKVVYPEANNPFKPSASDKVLTELAENKDILKKYIKLRGMMDGDEIIVVTDITSLAIKSDNPQLSKLPKPRLREYFENFGIFELIDSELTDVQQQYREELERRKQEKK